MAVYAISDLHLSAAEDKPMDIFGGNWLGYMNKLQDNWRTKIGNDDTVIIPGDLGWAMNLESAIEDFRWLYKMPGKKILLKGNHDYWWTTLTKMYRFLDDNNISEISFLFNNSYERDGMAICGTRGWICPEDENFKPEDAVIYKREIERLKTSVSAAKTMVNNGKAHTIIAVMHFPPFDSRRQETEFTEIICNSGIKVCIYGHLHSEGVRNAVEGLYNGVEYKLVSSDYLNFTPLLLD